MIEKVELDKFVTAFKEVFETSAALDSFEVLSEQEEDSEIEKFYGARIDVGSDKNKFALLVLAKPRSCQDIADSFIDSFFGEDDELLPDFDYEDAYSELMNMTAGVFNREYQDLDSELGIHLPYFLEGELKGDELKDFRCIKLKNEAMEITLCLSKQL